MIVVRSLKPTLLPKWAALFERASVPCYCRYWHFGGNKNEWLARCAEGPRANRAEHEAAVHTCDPGASGLVALEGEDESAHAIGWMKIAPRALLPKLRHQSVYRAHDLGSDAGVFSIGCILVDPLHRARGVARALLGAAPAFVRARGGCAIEAYPRRAPARMHDEEAWMGPEPLYIEHGFLPIAGEAPYPVLRLTLDS